MHLDSGTRLPSGASNGGLPVGGLRVQLGLALRLSRKTSQNQRRETYMGKFTHAMPVASKRSFWDGEAEPIMISERLESSAL
jgi:hypothetical protein